MRADREEGLLSEDGALETGKASYSIEPFLFAGGRLITWNDVATVRSLAEGGMPIPTVAWMREDVELRITAFAVDGGTALHLIGRDGDGTTSGGVLVARYSVRNPQSTPLKATLYLAVRPFQVNPPTQFLNTAGRHGRRPGSRTGWTGDPRQRRSRPREHDAHRRFRRLDLRRG